MRWFIASAAALLLVWGLYVASPYWALVDLARAVEGRRVEELNRHINLRAIRIALVKQIATEGIGSKAVSNALGGSDAGLTAGAAAAAVEPLLDQVVTTESMIALLQGLDPSRPEPARLGLRLRLDGQGMRDALTLVRDSRWRGFRNVSFRVPPGDTAGLDARLHFRLARLKWRLVAIDLSPEARRRLLEEVVRLHEARVRR